MRSHFRNKPNTRLARIFPFLVWLPSLGRKELKKDFGVGITGAVVALPQGIAFATIAGLPPQYGIYCGIIPVIIAALFGSSRILVSGPTTALSLVLFSSLSGHAEPGSAQYIQMVIEITLLVGVIQLAMGLARLGALVNFISHSVVIGFTVGVAVLIIASQAKNFLGITHPQVSHFQDILMNLYLYRDQTNPYAICVGLVTIVVNLVVKRFRPFWPYMLIAMLAGSLTAAGIIAIVGKETANIIMTGALPGNLPPLSVPHLTFDNLRLLFPVAFAIALIGLTEAVSIGRVLSDRAGHDIDGNQEFIGQGLSNIVGSFFSSYVSTGSFNRSGINFEVGARTPLAAIFSGLLLIPIAIFCAPLASYLPRAVLAAIMYPVAWHLLDIPHVIRIFKTSRVESLILGTTFLGSLLLDMHFAILLGILVSLILYLNRTSHPRVLPRVPDPRNGTRAFTTDGALPECPQLKIIRIDGSLYFGAIPHVKAEIRRLMAQDPGQKHLLIICSGINFIDLAGAEFLKLLAAKRRMAGGALYFYDLKEDLGRYFRFQKRACPIRPENIFPTKKISLQEIYKRLDHTVCDRCSKRIFLECSVPEGEEMPHRIDTNSGAK